MPRLLALASLVLVFTVHLHGQSPSASSPLQGRWVVTSAEHRWEAIYSVDGDAFRLNYVAAGSKEPRPTTFTTTPATEATAITLRREGK